MNWTPISEAMPPANKPVLLKQQRDGYEPFVIVGVLIGKHTLEADDDMVDADYVESMDIYYVPEGFYERVMNHDDFGLFGVDAAAPVIAWMKIPGGEA